MAEVTPDRLSRSRVVLPRHSGFHGPGLATAATADVGLDRAALDMDRHDEPCKPRARIVVLSIDMGMELGLHSTYR